MGKKYITGTLVASGVITAVGGNSTNWNTAHGWGNHTLGGYLTGSSLSGFATETYVNTQVSNLVASAPGTLDTLNELAAALGDDPNFATTVTNSIAGKLSLTGGTLTGDLYGTKIHMSQEVNAKRFDPVGAADYSGNSLGVSAGGTWLNTSSGGVGYLGYQGGGKLRWKSTGVDVLGALTVSGLASFQGTGNNYFTGNLGVGVTNPSSKLHVHTDIDNAYAIRIEGSTHNEAGVWTGLGIGGESSNTKAGLLFEDIGASYARGKLHICVNNETNQNSATPADAKLTVSNDGNVGIGTTSPSSKLDVAGDIASTGEITTGGKVNIYGSNSTGVESVLLQGYTGTDTLGSIRTRNNGGYNQSLLFYTSDISGQPENLTLTLDSAQNATFAGDITSNGVVTALGGNSTEWNLAYDNQGNYLPLTGGILSGHLVLNNSTINLSNAFFLKGRNNANTLDIGLIGRNTSDQVSIDPDGYGTTLAGNVGIGTTSPAFKLTVAGVTAIKESRSTYIDAVEDNTATSHIFTTNDSVGDFSQLAGNLVIQARVHASVYRDIIFAGGLNTAGPLMTIAGEGNVGIGVTNPVKPLQVNGAIATQRLGLDGVYGRRELTSSGHELDVPSGYAPLIVKSNGSEKMRINSAGNVGIGTTSPTQKLHVTGNARVTGAYYDSTNSPGAGGQVLTSTATGTDWIDPTLLPAESAEKVIQSVRFGEAVSKGDPLVITGYHGSSGPAIVEKADATDATKMPAYGVALEDYAINAEGLMIAIGDFDDFDTSGYNVGDTLYVAVGGGMTNVKPTGTGLIQNMGIVSRTNANNGQVEIIAIGRTNDVPNLPEGRLFVGTSGNTSLTSDAVYIDDTNDRVGIGTTSPSQKLEVVGTVKISDGTANTTIATSGSDTIFGNNSGGNIRTYISGSEKMRITAGGDMALGSTTPSTVGGTAKLTVDVGATSKPISIVNGTVDGMYIRRNTSGGSYQLQTTVGSTNTGNLSLQSYGGKVGIGTTSPNRKLHVIGQIAIDNSTSPSGGLLVSPDGSSNKVYSRTGNATSSAHPLDFISGSSNSMRIDTTGNVGIGTTNPSSKLEVAGTVEADAFGSRASVTRIYAPSGAFYNGSGTQTGYLIVNLPDNGTAGINNMMTGVIRVFDYSNPESFDIHFAGYWYSGYNWNSCVAWMDSSAGVDRNFNVRFGRNAAGTGPVITIGESTSTWDYCKFSVINYQSSHSNYELEKWDKGWSANIGTGWPGTSQVTVTDTQVNNWQRSGQDVYYGSGAGNVGIGTTSPASAKLVVHKSSGYIFRAENSTGSCLRVDGSNGNILVEQGNVGIGTTSPIARLDARSLNGSQPSLRIGRADTSSFWDFNHAGNDLRIYNFAGAGSDILLSIDSGGTDKGNNVGIGTSSPSTKLDVNGVITATGGNSTQWNTAYGWGNHASASYLTSGSLSGYATQTYVNTQVNNLVDSAPGTLDTLNELASALGDDPNFATTVTNSIAGKLPLTGGTVTGNLGISGVLNLDYGTSFLNGTVNYLIYNNAADSGLYVRDTTNGQMITVWTPTAFLVKKDLVVDGSASASNLSGTNTGDQDLSGLAVLNHTHNYQAAGTYNTVIGTDSDINTSGSTIIDNLYMTDGVITSHGTRTLTLGDLGYTGATNANYITNNTQLTNGQNYITAASNVATATNLASIGTSFSGVYPMTVNANGVIYSHTGITFQGNTGSLVVSGQVTAGGNVNTTGDIVLKNTARLKYQENIDVTGLEEVATVPVSHTAVFFDYVVKKGTNVRAGTLTVCHDGTNVEYVETSTIDLGNTSDVELTADISAGKIRMLAESASANWSIKTLIRAI